MTVMPLFRKVSITGGLFEYTLPRAKMLCGLTSRSATVSNRSTVCSSMCCTATTAVSSPNLKPDALARSNKARVTSRGDTCECCITNCRRLNVLEPLRVREAISGTEEKRQWVGLPAVPLLCELDVGCAGKV